MFTALHWKCGWFWSWNGSHHQELFKKLPIWNNNKRLSKFNNALCWKYMKVKPDKCNLSIQNKDNVKRLLHFTIYYLVPRLGRASDLHTHVFFAYILWWYFIIALLWKREDNHWEGEWIASHTKCWKEEANLPSRELIPHWFEKLWNWDQIFASIWATCYSAKPYQE